MARVVSYVPEILRQFSKEEEELVVEAGVLLKNEVRRLMTASPRGGRTYLVRPRGQTQKRLAASAPGQPPAVLTGRLKRSVQFKVRLTSAGFEAAVGSNRVGAASLEYGNKFTKPRPAWRPALENVLPKIKALFDRAR